MVCVYKGIKRITLAIECIENAIKFAKMSEDKEGMQISYLNGMSIFSVAQNYQRSILYAENAINLIKNEIENMEAEVSPKKVNENKALLSFTYLTLGLQEKESGTIND